MLAALALTSRRKDAARLDSDVDTIVEATSDGGVRDAGIDG